MRLLRFVLRDRCLERVIFLSCLVFAFCNCFLSSNGDEIVSEHDTGDNGDLYKLSEMSISTNNDKVEVDAESIQTISEESISQDSDLNSADGVTIEESDTHYSEEQIDMIERVLYGLSDKDQRLPSDEQRRRMSKEEYNTMLKVVWENRQQEVQTAFKSINNESDQISDNIELIKTASLTESTPELEALLENLEALVQQIDLGAYFVKAGGVAATTKLILNHDNSKIRGLGAHLVGTAIKYQTDCQLAALDATLLRGAIERLKTLESCNSENAYECGKMLYLLGSIIRGYDVAQTKAIEAGLLELNVKLLEDLQLDDRVAQSR